MQKRIFDRCAVVWWRMGVLVGLVFWVPAASGQTQQPGPQRPPPAEGLERLIGERGTLRSTGQLAVDFGLWLAALVGVGLVGYGFYDAIKQANEMEHQRRYGKAVMYIVGGAALSGIRVIWQWVAQAITGVEPATTELGF